MIGAMHPTMICLAAGMLSGARADPVELAFHPAEGCVLRRQYDVEIRSALDELFVQFANSDERLDFLDHSSWSDGQELATNLVTVDRFVRVGDGRPLELLREFEQLETVWDWDSRQVVHHPAFLRQVRFTWDEEEAAYDVEWARSRRSEPAPAGLWEDLDHRGLLPPEPVEVGASWEVPLGRLAPSLLPSGPIHRLEDFWETWNLFELEQSLASHSPAWLVGSAVTCTLVAIRDLGDRRLADVDLEWGWTTWYQALEVGSQLGWWERLGIDEGEFELEVRGEGQLVWDLDAGHFHSFELEARAEFDLQLAASWGNLSLGANARGTWSSEVLEDD